MIRTVMIQNEIDMKELDNDFKDVLTQVTNDIGKFKMKKENKKCYGENNITLEDGEFRLKSFCGLKFCPWCGRKLTVDFIIERFENEIKKIEAIKEKITKESLES